jgi:hypothetical protein
MIIVRRTRRFVHAAAWVMEDVIQHGQRRVQFV